MSAKTVVREEAKEDLKNVKVSVELITPQKATRMFGRNTPRGERIKQNRQISDRRVADFAKMMKEGRWILNGSSITFDAEGNLSDGQHRLMACMVSNTSFPTLVVRGCREEAGETIDTGGIRKPSDIAHMNKRARPRTLAAALNYLWYYRNEDLQRLNNTDLRLRKIDLIDFLGQNPGIERSAVDATSNGIGKFLPPSMAAFLHYVFSEKDVSMAETFFHSLASGENLHGQHPILVLREKLRDLKNEFSGRQRADRVYLLAMIIKAWNAFVAGRRMKVLRWNQKEDFPKIAEAS